MFAQADDGGDRVLELRIRTPTGACMCVLDVEIKTKKTKCRTVKTKTQVQMKYRVQENTKKKKIPPGAWMSATCECFVCCQVDVSATDRSLVQRSPTDSECVPECDQCSCSPLHLS